MTETVNFIVNFCVGFLSHTFRNYAANKLQDGDLTDQKIRDWIIPELENIKFKLDALSRKDLSVSISVFKKGIERLQTCFECSNPCYPSTSKLSINESELQDTASCVQMKVVKQSVTVEDAIALADAIKKQDIESTKRFKLAKECFKKAGEKATEAFHNAALSINEKICATEVCITSAMLENVDDPQLTIADCLHYLKELHALPAIKDIFSVHIEGGIRSLFKKDSRAEIVETVTTINLMLADFITKFTKRRMGILDWPMIKCSKRDVHPIYYQEESVRKLKEMKIAPPWHIALKDSLDMETGVKDVAINSQADVIAIHARNAHYDHCLLKLERETGKWEPPCLCSSDSKTRCDASMTIDDDDTVYVVSRVNTSKYVLSVYTSDGTITHSACPLDFIKGDLKGMTVTKDNKIVCCSVTHMVSGQINKDIYCTDVSVHVCDKMGELIKSFPCKLPKNMPIGDVCVLIGKSGDMIAVYQNTSKAIKLYVFTQEGRFEKIVKLMISDSSSVRQVTFNNVAKQYIVFYMKAQSHGALVECFSETGKLRYLIILDYRYPNWGRVVCHTNGKMAIVDKKEVWHLGVPKT